MHHGTNGREAAFWFFVVQRRNCLMKTFAFSAVIACIATSALAQTTTVHEEYYIVRDPATKRCTIVDHGIFGTRTEADRCVRFAPPGSLRRGVFTRKDTHEGAGRVRACVFSHKIVCADSGIRQVLRGPRSREEMGVPSIQSAFVNENEEASVL
jgi:hypothetical protein